MNNNKRVKCCGGGTELPACEITLTETKSRLKQNSSTVTEMYFLYYTFIRTFLLWIVGKDVVGLVQKYQRSYNFD